MNVRRLILCVLCAALSCAVFSVNLFSAGAKTEEAKTPDSDVLEEKSQSERRKDILRYGLDNEVVALIETLIKEKDREFLPMLADMFASAKSTALKDKIIDCCAEFEYSGLKDAALAVLEDPYDEKKSTVSAFIRYAEKIKLSEAAPFLRSIIEKDDTDFFNGAVSALGSIGSEEDASFLADRFESEDLTVAQKQNIVKALGKLKADRTFDALAAMARNEDENAFVRMYAAEAIGTIRSDEAADILIDLFDSTDPNLRQYVVKGLARNTSEKARAVLLAALKDNHYKVRLEAVDAVRDQRLTAACPSLLYRAQNDAEAVVKYACFDALASLNDKAGVDYMISLLEDSRRGDTLKAKVASSLLKYDIDSGVRAVIALAEKTLADDKKKQLRYALGKEFALHENKNFESICEAYLKSADVATRGTGLDIYKKNRFANLTSLVRSIAEEDKAASLKAKAKALIAD